MEEVGAHTPVLANHSLEEKAEGLWYLVNINFVTKLMVWFNMEACISFQARIQLNLTIPFQGIILARNKKWLPENKALL